MNFGTNEDLSSFLNEVTSAKKVLLEWSIAHNNEQR